MQCFLHRWNTFAIGHNAKTHSAIVSTLRQHVYQSPRHLSSSLRLKGQDQPAQAPTLKRSLGKPSRSQPLREVDVLDEIVPREHRLKSLANRRTKAHLENAEPGYEKQQWQVQKAALKAKFGDQAWSPQKRLSPDTMNGIRAMHNSDPSRFSTPVLAEHFKVSPEAIRRILKSKWQPSAEEQEKRRERWERRGERVWSSLAEIGVKPPKPWRVRGVGKAEPGDMPVWKGASSERGHRSIGRRATKDATTVRRGLVAERSKSARPVANAGSESASISKRIL